MVESDNFVVRSVLYRSLYFNGLFLLEYKSIRVNSAFGIYMVPGGIPKLAQWISNCT